MPLGASSLFKPPSFGFGSTVTEQGGAKAGIGLSPSAKVTGATVQVLKKPTNAFGLLLGNAGPKRKPDADKVRSVKLEQIRSSVNLPFHSFKGQAEQSKVVVEEPFKAIKVSQPPALVRSNAEDVIMLEDDSDEEVTRNSETKNTLGDDKDEGPAEKMEKKEDDMSLDELSTDLQKINQQLDENRKNTNEKKSQEQVKPFDYNAARTQVRFGEPKEKQQQGDKSIGNGSGLKKGNAALGKNPVDEANKEFGQGKRRQAFPASGNRSATFR
jgi:exosome complex exonuclease RRP6